MEKDKALRVSDALASRGVPCSMLYGMIGVDIAPGAYSDRRNGPVYRVDVYPDNGQVTAKELRAIVAVMEEEGVEISFPVSGPGYVREVV